MALAAAIAPKVHGSSTIGVKKSIVLISARASSMRITAASSGSPRPTSTSGYSVAGKNPASCRTTCDNVPGGSLDAQPAQATVAVSGTALSRSTCILSNAANVAGQQRPGWQWRLNCRRSHTDVIRRCNAKESSDRDDRTAQQTTVVVTGVSSGIGYATAAELIEQACTSSARCARQEDADRVQADLGDASRRCCMDVTDEAVHRKPRTIVVAEAVATGAFSGWSTTPASPWADR